MSEEMQDDGGSEDYDRMFDELESGGDDSEEEGEDQEEEGSVDPEEEEGEESADEDDEEEEDVADENDVNRLKREKAAAEHAAKSQAGRISAYQNQVAQLTAQLEAMQAQLVQAISNASGVKKKEAEAISEGDADDLAETFPELKPVLAKVAKLEEALEAKSQTLESIKAAQEKAAFEQHVIEQRAMLTAKLPGWWDTVNTTEWKKWADRKRASSPTIRTILDQNNDVIVDVEAAESVIRMFMVETGKHPGQDTVKNGQVTKKRDLQLKSGTMPSNRQRASLPSSTKSSSYEDLWNEQEQRDRQARRR